MKWHVTSFILDLLLSPTRGVQYINDFDEGLFNIMIDKAIINRDKSIEFIFNSGYKVKVEARK